MYIKNIREYKHNLRLQIRKDRNNISQESKSKMDAEIKKQLFQTKEYQESEIIFTYVSKSNEVDTINIIKDMLQNSKRVAVPRCIPEKYGMDFYEINSLSQLQKGCYGVLEPDPSLCRKVLDDRPCICLVPGLSFDSQGYRLGYGKGYYDRFLATFSGYTIGLCYCACLRMELPRGYFDRPVNILITEKYSRRILKHPVPSAEK